MSLRRSLLAAVVGIVGLGLVGWVVFCLSYPASNPDDRMMWHQSVNDLQQIARAILSYADVQGGRLPPAVVRGKDGKPLYSWRVVLLPYVEHSNLLWEFKLDEPWDSPNNLPLLAKMPPVYGGYLGEPGEESLTPYQVFVGPGTAFEHPGLRLAVDFPDGSANTFLVVEAKKPVPWTKPVDLEYDPAKPLPLLGGRFREPTYVLGRLVGWSDPVFNAAFADGSSRYFRLPVDERTVRAMITRNGSEPFDWP